MPAGKAVGILCLISCFQARGFYKIFCFLRSYGMICINHLVWKDEVSWQQALQKTRKNLPKQKRAGFSTTGPTRCTPPTLWRCCSPSTLAMCAPPLGRTTWCCGPTAPRRPPSSARCWPRCWALWPTTRAIRSGCSWPAWCWAWPLPCSPP